MRLRSSSITRAAEAKNGSNRVMSLRTSSISCVITRGVRAVRLVDQRASVGGAVEHDLLPPWRGQRLVIAEHALPGGARMRRFDQGIGEIAKLAFVFGELELRGLEADACRWPRRRASDACRRCANPRGCGRNRRRCSRRAPRQSRAASEPVVTEARRSGSGGTSPAFQTSDRSGAPTATATGRCALFRSAPAAGFVGFAFDPDNGKDQHGSHAIAWSAIHG